MIYSKAFQSNLTVTLNYNNTPHTVHRRSAVDEQNSLFSFFQTKKIACDWQRDRDITQKKKRRKANYRLKCFINFLLTHYVFFFVYDTLLLLVLPRFRFLIYFFLVLLIHSQVRTHCGLLLLAIFTRWLHNTESSISNNMTQNLAHEIVTGLFVCLFVCLLFYAGNSFIRPSHTLWLLLLLVVKYFAGIQWFAEFILGEGEPNIWKYRLPLLVVESMLGVSLC